MNEQPFEKPVPIRQFCDFVAWPSIRSLRHQYLNRVRLGLEEAFSRCGNRILIKPKLYFDLIEKQK